MGETHPERSHGITSADLVVAATSDAPSRVFAPPGADDVRLVGRREELGVIARLLREPSRGGRALVVRGDAGSGRSRLLTIAAHQALAGGMRVLQTNGAAAEQHVELAALYSLLRPVLDEVDAGRNADRVVLADAFAGIGSVPQRPFVVALATLGILMALAETQPVLVIVDDAQHLDATTLEVLSFVARRLATAPVVVLVASADGPEADGAFNGLPELRLHPLDDSAAHELLQARAPDLSTIERSMVVAQALGNPLALSELCLNVRTVRHGPVPVPVEIPLSDRLMATASTTVSGLSDSGRQLLVIAACDARPSRIEVLAAAEIIGHAPLAADEALVQAADAGVLVVEGPLLRFAEPLVRAAVYQSADAGLRREAHLAMSLVVTSGTSRQVWHEALSLDRPDTDVAAALDAAGRLAADEERMIDSLVAYERAAWLSNDRRARMLSLLAAADAAWELGAADRARRLIGMAEASASAGTERNDVAYVRRMIDENVGLRDVHDLLENAPLAAEPSSMRRWLARVAGASLVVAHDAAVHATVAPTRRAFGLSDDDPIVAAVRAIAERTSDPALGNGLRRVAPSRIDLADVAFAMGAAATSRCDWSSAAQFLDRAVQRLRAQRRVVMLVQALTLRSWARIALADFERAEIDAEEAANLAAVTEQCFWGARALAACAHVAAIRGDARAVDEHCDGVDRRSGRQAGAVARWDVLAVRGHLALSQGRYADAARLLAGLYDERPPTVLLCQQVSAIGDYVEASVRAGNPSPAHRAVEALVQHPTLDGPAELVFAQHLLAVDVCADEPFVGQRDFADLTPFLRARAQLAFGASLRRARRVAMSREPLEEAAVAFEALGASVWADRATEELRATGLRRRARHSSHLQLTEREDLVARLAASGLSNRQIGQRLILSSRTVGAHLYRIFPKLGVSSRSELRDVLAIASGTIVT